MTTKIDRRAAIEANVKRAMERASQAPAESAVVDTPQEARSRAIPANPAVALVRELEANMATELRDAKRELEEYRKGGGERSIPTDQIVQGRWSNRHVAAFGDSKFRQLVADIRTTNGNTDPILVRPIASANGEPRFELVYGRRRHRACQELGIPVNAIVRDVLDSEVPLYIEFENEDREDLSSYERGMQYARLLRDGWVENAAALGERFNRDKASISKLLAFAELPDDFYALFADPRRVSVKDAAALRACLNADGASFRERVRRCREEGIKSPKSIVATVLAQKSENAWVEYKSKGKPILKSRRAGDRCQIEVLADVPKAVLNELADFLGKRLTG